MYCQIIYVRLPLITSHRIPFSDYTEYFLRISYFASNSSILILNIDSKSKLQVAI